MHYLGLVMVVDPTKEKVATAMADSSNRHWDWYRCGGRWDGWLQGPNEEKARENDNGFNFQPENDNPARNCVLARDYGERELPTFFVDEWGTWWQRRLFTGRSFIDNPDFEPKFREMLSGHPDKWLVVVDAHN